MNTQGHTQETRKAAGLLLADGLLVWALLLATWVSTVSLLMLADAGGDSPLFAIVLVSTSASASWVGVWAWLRGRWSIVLLAWLVVGLSPWIFPFIPFASIVAVLPLIFGAMKRRRTLTGVS